MKGDFSRNTFDVTKHFSRVLQQQGRVQLDADWNEQTSILLHYLQTLAADLIGEHGGPRQALGFALAGTTDKDHDFALGRGRYYVNGRLCENENRALTYTSQPDYPQPPELKNGSTYLVYLDVWERLITAVQDDHIREVALGGPDTTSRAKVVWQVKTESVRKGTKCATVKWDELQQSWQPLNRGQLKADAKKGSTDDTDPCLIAPDARYRGPENQLYRVEIHAGGQVDNDKPTFKWSRENGSVVFPIRMLSGSVVTVEHLGRDGRFSLQPGDWVEIVDDDITNRGEANRLQKVKSIDRVEFKVTLEDDPAFAYDEDARNHPILRRWEGYDAVTESTDAWLPLEDGIRIQFQPALKGEAPHQYRTGDYWLIPARTATGDIEWPEGADSDGEMKPMAQRPQGDHVYAPLGIIQVANGTVTLGEDCRHSFTPLAV